MPFSAVENFTKLVWYQPLTQDDFDFEEETIAYYCNDVGIDRDQNPSPIPAH